MGMLNPFDKENGFLIRKIFNFLVYAFIIVMLILIFIELSKVKKDVKEIKKEKVGEDEKNIVTKDKKRGR